MEGPAAHLVLVYISVRGTRRNLILPNLPVSWLVIVAGNPPCTRYHQGHPENRRVIAMALNKTSKMAEEWLYTEGARKRDSVGCYIEQIC